MHISAVYLLSFELLPFFCVTQAAALFILCGATQHTNELKVLSSSTCVVGKVGKVLLALTSKKHIQKAWSERTYSWPSVWYMLQMQRK